MKTSSPTLTPSEAAKCLLHVPGREIPATVIAKRASEIRRALSGGEILGIPYLAGSQIRYRTTLDAVLQWDQARRNPLQAVQA
jgi:hypothetical protein